MQRQLPPQAFDEVVALVDDVQARRVKMGRDEFKQAVIRIAAQHMPPR